MARRKRSRRPVLAIPELIDRGGQVPLPPLAYLGISCGPGPTAYPAWTGHSSRAGAKSKRFSRATQKGNPLSTASLGSGGWGFPFAW